MKRIREQISVLVLTVFLLASNALHANPVPSIDDIQRIAGDMEISLLTCAPGQEVYSLYGHTAIKIDFGKIDSTAVAGHNAIVVNYGMFSFRKSFFVLRFMFGLTDYEIGLSDETAFEYDYRDAGRSVVQQTLNLTTAEKLAIWQALSENYKPENRVYRYNYFYDNCTTRARDILLRHINGSVSYPGDKKSYPSYRAMIHSMNENNPWARFGNDILLGVKADASTDLQQQQFLPGNLMRDFDKAVIKGPDGKTRKLVKETKLLVDASPITHDGGFPLTPSQCAWLLFAVVAAATLVEWRLKRNFWLLDALLMVVSGCAGVILFLMVFSQHPTTSLNLQLLLLNPLPLIFLWRAVKRMRQQRPDWLWALAGTMIYLFLIGGIWQSYAEGMLITALTLWIRVTRRTGLNIYKKK